MSRCERAHLRPRGLRKRTRTMSRKRLAFDKFANCKCLGAFGKYDAWHPCTEWRWVSRTSRRRASWGCGRHPASSLQARAARASKRLRRAMPRAIADAALESQGTLAMNTVRMIRASASGRTAGAATTIAPQDHDFSWRCAQSERVALAPSDESRRSGRPHYRDLGHSHENSLGQNP